MPKTYQHLELLAPSQLPVAHRVQLRPEPRSPLTTDVQLTAALAILDGSATEAAVVDWLVEVLERARRPLPGAKGGRPDRDADAAAWRTKEGYDTPEGSGRLALTAMLGHWVSAVRYHPTVPMRNLAAGYQMTFGERPRAPVYRETARAVMDGEPMGYAIASHFGVLSPGETWTSRYGEFEGLIADGALTEPALKETGFEDSVQHHQPIRDLRQYAALRQQIIGWMDVLRFEDYLDSQGKLDWTEVEPRRSAEDPGELRRYLDERVAGIAGSAAPPPGSWSAQMRPSVNDSITAARAWMRGEATDAWGRRTLTISGRVIAAAARLPLDDNAEPDMQRLLRGIDGSAGPALFRRKDAGEVPDRTVIQQVDINGAWKPVQAHLTMAIKRDSGWRRYQIDTRRLLLGEKGLPAELAVRYDYSRLWPEGTAVASRLSPKDDGSRLLLEARGLTIDTIRMYGTSSSRAEAALHAYCAGEVTVLGPANAPPLGPGELRTQLESEIKSLTDALALRQFIVGDLPASEVTPELRQAYREFLRGEIKGSDKDTHNDLLDQLAEATMPAEYRRGATELDQVPERVLRDARGQITALQTSLRGRLLLLHELPDGEATDAVVAAARRRVLEAMRDAGHRSDIAMQCLDALTVGVRSMRPDVTAAPPSGDPAAAGWNDFRAEATQEIAYREHRQMVARCCSEGFPRNTSHQHWSMER